MYAHVTHYDVWYCTVYCGTVVLWYCMTGLLTVYCGTVVLWYCVTVLLHVSTVLSAVHLLCY